MNSFFKIGLIVFGISFSTSACADTLGKLFFTPGQRTQLDYNYARNIKPEDNANALILNGIVQQHGGKRTVWINGVPQPAIRGDERTPEVVPVPLPGQKKSVRLKVGQRVLLDPSATPNTAESAPQKPDMPKQDAPKP